MKKAVLFTVFLAFVINVFSQDSMWQVYTKKEHYLKKSKNQRTTGWILLGVGTTLAVIGVSTFSSSWDHGSNTETDILGWFIVGGVAMDLASIPFFISAGNNQRRAAEIVIINQKMYLPQKNSVAVKYVPGITFKIHF